MDLRSFLRAGSNQLRERVTDIFVIGRFSTGPGQSPAPLELIDNQLDRPAKLSRLEISCRSASFSTLPNDSVDSVPVQLPEDRKFPEVPRPLPPDPRTSASLNAILHRLHRYARWSDEFVHLPSKWRLITVHGKSHGCECNARGN